MIIKKIVNVLLIISFVIYIFFLIWIIFLKANVISWIDATKLIFKDMSIKEKIMYDIIPFLNNSFVRIRSNVYNILVFIPLPIMLKSLIPRLNYFSLYLSGLALPVLIELFQLFIPYCGFASEDIICNSLGFYLGVLIYKLFLKKWSELEIKLLLIASTLFFIPIFVYALINTIKCIEVYF